jgi:two-component system chemotaxis response regulator CheY
MSKKVLTIDDSQSVRQMISMTLCSAGFTVEEACDGAEGYAKATAGSYSAIITDLNMPNMSGLDFIKKFRAHPASRGVPIIFLSTESDEDSKREAKSAGAIGWIVKPFDQNQLLAAIRKVAGA